MKLERFKILWIYLALIPLWCFAQTDTPVSESIGAKITQDLKHFGQVGLGLLGAPLHFDSGDWAKVGLAAGGTALLFAVDKQVKDFALRNQSALNNSLFGLDNYHGNHYSLYLGLGIYAFGALGRDNSIRKMGLYAAEAFIYAGALTGGLKFLFGRRRPYGGNNHLYFDPFQIHGSTFKSLPSGHTTASFAVSTALAKSVDNMYWKVFWYGTAGLVGASRIYHNKHWLSDVFLGAIIGYSVGTFVVHFQQRHNTQIQSYDLSVFFTGSGVGMGVVF